MNRNKPRQRGVREARPAGGGGRRGSRAGEGGAVPASPPACRPAALTARRLFTLCSAVTSEGVQVSGRGNPESPECREGVASLPGRSGRMSRGPNPPDPRKVSPGKFRDSARPRKEGKHWWRRAAGLCVFTWGWWCRGGRSPRVVGSVLSLEEGAVRAANSDPGFFVIFCW